MNPRIYHPESLSTGISVILSKGAAAHVGKVLRLAENDTLYLFNGDGYDYHGHITRIERHRIVVTIDASVLRATESPLPITLLQGICRNPRMDLLIQKSTELGVHRIVPIRCQRSVTRIDAVKAVRKTEHWKNIAISACEQSGRAQLPHIHSPCTPAAAFAQHAPENSTRLLLDPDGDQAIAEELRPGIPVSLLIGPEGGLTAEEISLATTAGFKRIRLGPRVLRTETAPLAALSIIQFLIGDLNQAP